MTVHARPGRAGAVVDLVARIGHDHALTAADLGPLDAAGAAAAPWFWAAYEQHWRGFCGARLDPMGWQLAHPARLTGAVRVGAGAPVLVVGTGPSLAPALPDLRRLRRAVHLITSPRGADVLASAGLVPDLVVVEHQTALDAQFSLGEQSHRPSQVLARVPFVAAEARTPAALLAGVPADRLFVPDPWPAWGLWPATAVSLGLAAGAGAVGLVGVDLGTRARPDPLHAPLRDLLGLLARFAGVPCLDLSASGAVKAGWTPATLEALAAGGGVEPLRLDARPWLTLTARESRARQAWHRLTPLVAHGATTLAAASLVRDGDRSLHARDRMLAGFEQLLAAGDDLDTRIDVQDVLGLSFLPRFWRRVPDPALGAHLWRAAALASHELLQQHRTLGQRLERAA